MKEVIKNNLPSITDVVFLIGLGLLSAGMAAQWGWTIAAQVAGVVLLSMSVVAKFRGDD